MPEKEYRNVPSFKPWGPFISPHYELEPITYSDVIIASVVFALTLVNVILALWIGYGQTKSARAPWRSVYIWLIWLELLVDFIMALECFLHLTKIIPPSFWFYMTILFWWCIQVQLLLQIIINRIRVIEADRRKSRWMMIGTAVIVTLINISVFNIWIPARLQISERYVHINEIWDRVEKGIYLVIDAALNWYFLRTVKQSLVDNGLTKYDRLLRFNRRIIVLSLSMDVMIIAAMSIPNSFVYIQFHPLAYLVKLNIEMTMASLIKKIAVSTAKVDRHARRSVLHEYALASPSLRDRHMSTDGSGSRSGSVILKPFKHFTKSHFRPDDASSTDGSEVGQRQNSIIPHGNQIKRTQEITVRCDPNPDYVPTPRKEGWPLQKSQSMGSVQSQGTFGIGVPIGIEADTPIPTRRDSFGSELSASAPLPEPPPKAGLRRGSDEFSLM